MTTAQHTGTTSTTCSPTPADPTTERNVLVAVAWPTGRLIYAYSSDEIADGVDLYTRAMKTRAAGTAPRGDHDAPER